MIIGVGIMIIAGWKLLMGVIGSFGFNVWNYQLNGNASSSSSLQTNKFVKRSEEVNHQVENNNEDHQVFIPVVSVY
jgi:hypothetical protein